MGVLEGAVMVGDRPRDDSGKFLPTGEARDKNLIVRMTESEKQEFYNAARDAGYRPSDLVRELIERWLEESQSKKQIAV